MTFDLGASPFAGQDIRTLPRAQANARRNKAFLVLAPFQGETRSWSYGAFLARAEAMAAGLWRRGVRPGDRMLIHLENCPGEVRVLEEFPRMTLGNVSKAKLRALVSQG
jgi:acyl-CoA synthetase (AMP-forming)/AMP-acid ligase II